MSTEPAPSSEPPEAASKAMSVRGATVLGIGSMIGAGIFALLGEAGALAGAAVWISFLIGGIVADSWATCASSSACASRPPAG